jgi:autotransporter translocation and assembly factor TamB
MALALLLPLFAWAVLQSPLNGPILSYCYNQWLAEPEEKIIIASTVGLFPFNAICQDIQLYQKNRLLLKITKLDWQINFSQILKGKITLQNLQAEKVFIDLSAPNTTFQPHPLSSLMFSGFNVEKAGIKILKIVNKKQEVLPLTLEASFYNDQNTQLQAHALISQPETTHEPLKGLFNLTLNIPHNAFEMKAEVKDTAGHLSHWAGSRTQIPCHLMLDGQGDLSDWSGHVTGKILGIEALKSEIKLQTRPDHSLHIFFGGKLKFASLKDAINFNLNVHKPTESYELEATSHIDILDNSLELNAHIIDGRLGQLNGKWHILNQTQLNDLLSLSSDMEFPTGDFHCEMDTEKPSFAFSSNIQHLAIGQQRFKNIACEFSASYATINQQYQWRLKSTATDALDDTSVSLISNGLLDQDLRSCFLHHISAEGYGGTLLMDGQLQILSKINGKINFHLTHSNGLSVSSNITCLDTPINSSSSITFDHILMASPDLPHTLATFAQMPARLSFDMQLSSPFQLQRLNFSHPLLSIRGDSRIDLDSDSLTAHLDFQSSLALSEPELKGNISGILDLSGSLVSPHVKGQFMCDKCAIGKNFDVDEVTGELSGEIFKSMNISAHAIKDKYTLGLMSCVNYDHDQLTFNNTEIQTDNNWIRSKSVSYPFADKKPVGVFNIHITNLNSMTPFLGQPLSGSAFGDVTFTTKGPQKTHHTLIKMNLTGLEYKDISCSLVDLDLDVTTQSSGTQFSGGAKIENVTTAHVDIRKMNITAQPLPLSASTKLSMSILGDIAFPFEIIGHSTVEFVPWQKFSLVLDSLSGHINDHSIMLLEPALLTQTPNEFIGSGNLKIGEGTLSAHATFGHISNADLHLKNLPASILLNSMCVGEVNGTVDGTFKLKTNGASPKFSFFVKGHDLSAVGFEQNTVDLGIEIENSKEEIHANGYINTNKNHTLTFKMLTPIHFSLTNLLATTPENICIQCDGDIELTPLSDMLTSEEHTITGLLNIHSNLSFGKNASLKGTAFINNGTYENIELGTILKNFKAALSFENKQATIDLIGLDSGNGKIKVAGGIDFSRKTPLYNLKANLIAFHAFQMDDLHAGLNGSLSLESKPKSLKPTLSGNLEITPFHYNISDSAHNDLTPLKNHDLEEHLTSKHHESPPSLIDLDIGLTFPKSIILTGRGLESLWDGQIRLHGSILSPILNGQFHLKNGRFNFAGKILTLTHGHINFDNRENNDPLIDVEAKVQTPELVAIFELAKRASDPSFSVHSDPVNHTDEIISQVLFGKSPGQINFSQSLQLASAIQSLRTPGGGLTGIMDTVRSTMGLDSISLKETYDLEKNDTKTAISVGKYISEKVYVSIDQDVSGGGHGNQASIEITLTPQTSVETNVGTNFGGGFNWRWRY